MLIGYMWSLRGESAYTVADPLMDHVSTFFFKGAKRMNQVSEEGAAGRGRLRRDVVGV